MSEIHAIACNYSTGTNIAREGARTYLLWRTGGEDRRCKVLVKSRRGRWVEKWEAIWRLDKFRVVMVSDAAPEFRSLEPWRVRNPGDLSEALNDIVACQMGALADRARGPAAGEER